MFEVRLVVGTRQVPAIDEGAADGAATGLGAVDDGLLPRLPQVRDTALDGGDVGGDPARIAAAAVLRERRAPRLYEIAAVGAQDAEVVNWTESLARVTRASFSLSYNRFNSNSW